MALEELARRLLAADKNVLVADVCVLFDVIRATARYNPFCVEFAVRMDNELRRGKLPFSLVLPSLFSQEWEDNVEKVRAELIQMLETHRKLSQSIDRLHQDVHGLPLPSPDATTLNFAGTLEEICGRIAASAYVIERQDEFDLSAMRRVRECRAPASRGKSEPKDCQIFEETLGLGRELRRLGFTRKIVFASSNKTDYGTTSKPLPDVKDDLDSIGAELTTELNHAYRLASS